MKEFRFMNKVVFTSGDYNGIGLECFYKMLKQNNISNLGAELALIANKKSLFDYFKACNINDIEIKDNELTIGDNTIQIIPAEKETKIELGKITATSGGASAESVVKALDLVSEKKYDAMVTLPINKKSIYLSGWKYPGHTEMLAAKFGIDTPLMVLTTGKIHLAIATIHNPLKQVPSLITADHISFMVRQFNDSLRNDLGIEKPKIAMLGLNPHSGEEGSLGKEEIEHIIPAKYNLKEEGINVSGPFPSDGFFAHKSYKNYDGILAMYHDQGLIPIKMLSNGEGINFTGNLPIVRTSPDHGTAFEIAGKNKANPASTLNALKFALKVISFRKY